MRPMASEEAPVPLNVTERGSTQLLEVPYRSFLLLVIAAFLFFDVVSDGFGLREELHSGVIGVVQAPAALRAVLPDGHWRWGADAAPFATASTHAPCAYYAYHEGCCMHDSQCANFSGAFVLNDGSALQGFAEIDAALAGGKRLLVIGDSMADYMGRALVCLGSLSPPPSVADTVVQLPSGGAIDVRKVQKCEGLGDISSLFAEFDFVVTSYGLWYHEFDGRHDRDFLVGCFDEIMRAMAALRASPGKAGAFLSAQPMHFPSVDGAHRMVHHRECGDPAAACFQETSIDFLEAKGFGASARARGPFGTVSACRPSPAGMVQNWDAVSKALAEVRGIALVDLSRLLRDGFYGAHLANWEHLDCGHSCFSTALFAPVWDTITRTLLHAASAGPTSALQPPLTLSIDSVCPQRFPPLAMIPADAVPGPLVELLTVSRPAFNVSRQRTLRAAARAKQARASLSVTVGTDGLRRFYNALHHLTSNSDELSELPLINVDLSVAGGAGSAIVVLAFLEVFYFDIQAQAEGEEEPRKGFETVFLAQLSLAPPERRGSVTRATLEAPVSKWMRAGAAQGDEYSLRVFACESSGVAVPQSAGEPLCAAVGATGCAVVPISL